MSSFDLAVEWTLEHEGGWSDNPNDRGGKTRYGITEEVAKDFGYDVRSLTPHQARSIYRAKYWRHGELSSQRVATKVFDIGVNAGVSTGTTLLQRAVRRYGGEIEVDGLLGPRTIAAANKMEETQLLHALVAEQVLYYAAIINNNYKVRSAGLTTKDQSAFCLGWMRRAVALP